MPKIANFLFVGLVIGTCIDHDHPQYGDCLQKCETDFSMCKSKCNEDSVCINACDDEQIACIEICPCCKITEVAKCAWRSLDEIKAQDTIFHQLECANIEDAVHIEAVINWQPKSLISKATSEHAVHIHQYGTIENENGEVNCDGSGPHFYKNGQDHGKPEDTPPERHYGDLGNIIRSVDGDMRIYFVDKHISLKRNNQSYVGGRTLDFHEFKDDWSSSANSGRRVACCLIEHGDNIQMPEDNDAILTSSTEKITETSTTSDHSTTESSSESTTPEQSTDASKTMFVSIILFSFLIMF